MSAVSSRTGRSLVLLAPLLLFLIGFFVWPLFSMMSQAVSDPAVLRLLPRSAEVLTDWDRKSPPTMPMQTALMEDLKAVDDDQALGDMVRRLNSARSGFRTLMSKTTSALDDTANPPADLVSIDKRWEKPEFWLAIADALSPLTDRNLLAAVDLGRNAAGDIEHLPADRSVNRVILVRTFWIAALVTFACAGIGFPYAMIAASLTGWKRDLMLAAVLLPLWTSLLVRTAAWFILLQEKGLINDLLQTLGLIDAPLPLIFNRTGVIIAMTHVLLPFMVLPIYSVLITIPKNLMPAAASLGAPPLARVPARAAAAEPARRRFRQPARLHFCDRLLHHAGTDWRAGRPDDQLDHRLLRHRFCELGHGRGAWRRAACRDAAAL